LAVVVGFAVVDFVMIAVEILADLRVLVLLVMVAP